MDASQLSTFGRSLWVRCSTSLAFPSQKILGCKPDANLIAPCKFKQGDSLLLHSKQGRPCRAGCGFMPRKGDLCGLDFLLCVQSCLLTNILGGIKNKCRLKTKVWYLYPRMREAIGDVLEGFSSQGEKKISHFLSLLFVFKAE